MKFLSETEIQAMIGCSPKSFSKDLAPYRIVPGDTKYGFGLEDYKEYGQSSHGEYGVVKEISRRLQVTQGVACEFGAWNGKRSSNTFDLVADHDWSCVMIENHPLRFQNLMGTAAHYPNISPYCDTIHYLPEKGILLDDFFKSIKFPCEFDLLSIDIDSCDYQVWDSLKDYSPKIVVIEADNLELDIIQEEGISHKCLGGSTCYPPMKRLGESKGYTLVEYTYNLIFVRNDLIDRIKP